MDPIIRPDWNETASVPAEETEPATHLIIPAETFEPDDDEDAVAPAEPGQAVELGVDMLDDWSRSGGIVHRQGVAQGAARGVLDALPAGAGSVCA